MAQIRAMRIILLCSPKWRGAGDAPCFFRRHERARAPRKVPGAHCHIDRRRSSAPQHLWDLAASKAAAEGRTYRAPKLDEPLCVRLLSCPPARLRALGEIRRPDHVAELERLAEREGIPLAVMPVRRGDTFELHMRGVGSAEPLGVDWRHHLFRHGSALVVDPLLLLADGGALFLAALSLQTPPLLGPAPPIRSTLHGALLACLRSAIRADCPAPAPRTRAPRTVQPTVALHEAQQWLRDHADGHASVTIPLSALPANDAALLRHVAPNQRIHITLAAAPCTALILDDVTAPVELTMDLRDALQVFGTVPCLATPAPTLEPLQEHVDEAEVVVVVQRVLQRHVGTVAAQARAALVRLYLELHARHAEALQQELLRDADAENTPQPASVRRRPRRVSSASQPHAPAEAAHVDTPPPAPEPAPEPAPRRAEPKCHQDDDNEGEWVQVGRKQPRPRPVCVHVPPLPAKPPPVEPAATCAVPPSPRLPVDFVPSWMQCPSQATVLYVPVPVFVLPLLL